MTAAAVTYELFVAKEEEEDTMPPQPPRRSRPDIIIEEGEPSGGEEQFEHWSAKQLSIRAINSTLALAQEVGKLAAAVAQLETKLHEDYEDTKTHNLRSLKAENARLKDHDKWFKRIISAVVTAVVVAEVLRMLNLGGHGG